MRWDQLDIQAATWTLETTKARRGHVVPLSPLAIDVLAALSRKASRYVFTTSGETPISGFSKAKARLDQVIAKESRGEALTAWTIHDLRRTCATTMGRLGVSRFIIGKVLNHADRSVTGIYDRFAYLQEKRHALESWARHLSALVTPTSRNVVAIRTLVTSQ